MQQKVDFKCVLLGKAAVGKTCLVERFLHDRWGKQAETIGAAFGSKEISVGKRKVVLGVWDTAGSERYEAMTRHYYKGAEAAVICYDLTDAKSWEKVKYWVSEILAVEENCILAIVGTKLDLVESGGKRAVEKSVVTKYASQMNASYYETSAMTGENVSSPFNEVVKEWAAKGKEPVASGAVPLRPPSPEESTGGGGCCGK